MKPSTQMSMILNIAGCLTGGALIGFNAGRLNDRLSAALFVAGLALVSISTTMLGLRAVKKEKDPSYEKQERQTQK